MWKRRFPEPPTHRPRRRFSYMPPESLRCKECRTTYPLEARYVCEQCFGPLKVAYPSRDGAAPAELRRRIQAGPPSLWRYGDFLPVAAPPPRALQAGLTPLLRADGLAEQFGLEHVWIKNDAANPTHSFKDRVVSMAIARALEVGLVEGRLPVFNGAQAEGCSPVATAFHDGQDFCRPVRPSTIAKSLAIGNPADGPYALELARRSGGAIDSVTDDEIRDGIRLLAETTGIFTETAGGTTTATLAKLADRGDIGPDERVVLVITGEGLKTLDAVRGTFESYEIAPSYDAFESAVGVTA